jgi:hypothetical protein
MIRPEKSLLVVLLDDLQGRASAGRLQGRIVRGRHVLIGVMAGMIPFIFLEFVKLPIFIEVPAGT